MGFWDVNASVAEITRKNEREARQAAARKADEGKRKAAAAVKTKRSI